VLRGRLDRGRILLRDRLTRRGLSLPAVLLGAAVAEGAIPTETLTRVALTPGAATRTVLTLTDGVVNAMRWSKLKTVAGLCLAFGLVACGAAGLLPQSRARATADEKAPPPAAAKAAPGEVRFPDGSSVTLLGVERPAAGRAWLPDGTPTDRVVGAPTWDQGRGEEANRPAFVFTFLVRNPPKGADLGYWSASFGDGSYAPTLSTPPEASEELGGTVIKLAARYAGARDETKVRFGFARRGWRTAAIRAGEAGRVRTFDWPDQVPAPEITLEPIAPVTLRSERVETRVRVKLPEGVRWSADWQALVTDKAGETHRPSPWARPVGGGDRAWEFGVAAGEIDRVELRARYFDTDYQWASYDGVSLAPDRKTRVTGKAGR
jgi:hypothetical protein